MALILALCAAALFGLVPHIQRAALPHTDVRTGAAITVATMAAMFWLVAPFIVRPEWWFTQAALIFAACGLVFPVCVWNSTVSMGALAHSLKF